MRFFESKIVNKWVNGYRENDLLKRFATVARADILVKACGFILIPFYLRLMTQDEYGSFNFIVSVVQTLGLFLTFGLYMPKFKFYNNPGTSKDRGSMLFTLAISLVFFVGVILIPFFFFGLDYFFAGKIFKNTFIYERYRSIIAPALIITIFGFFLTYFLFASEKIKQAKAYNYWRICFMVVTGGGLFFLKGDTVKTRLMFTYGYELILIVIFGRHFLKELTIKFNGKVLLRSLTIGMPIMFITLLGMMINFSDKFFLEKYGSLKDLSTYYFAFSFAAIIPLIATSLQNVWMPLFMKEQAVQQNDRKTKKFISTSFFLFLTIAVFVFLFFITLFAFHIIPNKYYSAIYILPILLIAQICMAVTTLLNNYLVFFEKTYMLLLAGCFTGLISVLLNTFLIPLYGIGGAAYAALASNIVYMTFCYFLVRLYKKKIAKKNIQFTKLDLGNMRLIKRAAIKV